MSPILKKRGEYFGFTFLLFCSKPSLIHFVKMSLYLVDWMSTYIIIFLFKNIFYGVKNVRIKVKQKSAGLCACLIRQPKAKANRNKLEQGKKTTVWGEHFSSTVFLQCIKSVFCLNEKVCKSISAHSFSLAAAIRYKLFFYTERY
jgi:hypothetical protein